MYTYTYIFANMYRYNLRKSSMCHTALPASPWKALMMQNSDRSNILGESRAPDTS